MDNEALESVKEIAKAAGTALEITKELGGFLTRIFGTVPEDAIGVIVGDWLRHVRIRNFDGYARKTEKILKERGIENKTEPISPSIAIPLLRAALDETRDELQELWARMIANAMDSSRSSAVRQSIISTVKSLDPLDAVILQKSSSLADDGGYGKKNVLNLPRELGVSNDEFTVSIQNLKQLNCVLEAGGMDKENRMRVTSDITFTPFGREILRACSI